jgi:hypothetical protein
MFSQVKDKEIKVCECDEKTPLMWTFKFNGCEYWCPRCGYMSGMFGAGINVPLTTELEKSKKDWEKKSKAYLSGKTDKWEYSDDN